MRYGIDIGSTSLKVVALSRTLKGFRLVGVSRRRSGDTSTPEGRAHLLRMLIESIGPKDGNRPVGVVGLSGRDINLQVVQQPSMSATNYRVMMGYELDQRRGTGDDLYLDYCTLREPDAYFKQYLALVGIGKRSYVDERIDLLAKASMDVRDAVPNSFALYAAYHHAYGVEDGNILLLDIGSDNMDIAVVRSGRLVFARNVSNGARLFDTSIAGMVSVPMEQAELLKVKHANLGPTEEEEGISTDIRAAVRTAAGQLSGFITSSINHAKLQLGDRDLSIDKIYLSGGGARIPGLTTYMAGALKTQVETLDPFRNLDTSGVEAEGASDLKQLPADMTIPIGLAQIASPGSSTAVLSILPDRIKKRRNFFRTTLWLGVAGVLVVAAFLAMTIMAVARRKTQTSALADFKARTADVRERIAKMDALEVKQLDASSKLAYLLSLQPAARGAMDVTARLQRVLPEEVTLREIRLVEPPTPRGEMERERQGAAVLVRGRGLVVGEIIFESEKGLLLKGESEPIGEGARVGDVIRWPHETMALLIKGEVEESIRGGPQAALNAVCNQLSDASREVRAIILKQSPSNERSGWRVFELLVTFDKES